MSRIGHIAAMLAVLLLVACGDGGSSTSTGSSGGQGGQGGQGGSGGAGGQGGTGGEGQGGAAPSYGPAASDFVNTGGVSTSKGFKLVWTLGQSTQNQSTSKSAQYRLQGGLTGANGSLP